MVWSPQEGDDTPTPCAMSVAHTLNRLEGTSNPSEEGFVPSRNRILSELRKADASFPQPSGHALPAIIPSGVTARIQHLNSEILDGPFFR